MFACNGILFNHESPIRGETFVTRKITRGLARISAGLESCLFLGNIDSLRDWGHARDYVEAQWLMLQQPEPEDFVIATGKTYAVRDFMVMAFAEAGIELEFKGEGVDEKAFVKACNNPDYQLPAGKLVMSVDARYFRPTEVELLIGDATKAMEKLNWKPKYDLDMLVREMVAGDIDLFKKDKYLMDGGHKIFNYYE